MNKHVASFDTPNALFLFSYSPLELLPTLFRSFIDISLAYVVFHSFYSCLQSDSQLKSYNTKENLSLMLLWSYTNVLVIITILYVMRFFQRPVKWDDGTMCSSSFAHQSKPLLAYPSELLNAIIWCSFVSVQPLIKVTNQLVAAPVNSDVMLQCYVEASPHAMNTWYKDPGEKLTSSTHLFSVTENKTDKLNNR